MNITKRVVAMFLCMATVLFAVYTAKTEVLVPQEEKQEDRDSLVIWYTDESLTDYINHSCVAYNEQYGVRVIPRLQSGDEYLEQINVASIKDEGTPDLYIVSNDVLERAYLGGLATTITTENTIFDNNFPQAAKQAVTYKDNKVAYPFYYETSALIYNRSYLQEMASNKLMAEESTEPDEEPDDEELADEAVVDDESGLTTEEKIEKRINEAIPETFEELMEFADTYDAPMEVETIFKWDVKDIFYNYFFVGNYMDVGGENGDDSNQINIYNMDVITALTVYQDLNQFFSFDYEDVTYDSVVNEFIEGKIVFITATSDVIKKLEDAKQEGTFNFEYGIAKIPNLNDNLISRGMSVTSTVVVNGFSDKKDIANSFAKFITIDEAGELYNMTGKLSASNNVKYDNEYISLFADEYSQSRPVPKMMATSNYWLLAEIAFSNIWSGKNVNSEVKNLSEQLKEQVMGVAISEDYIDSPSKEETEVEYFDEDAEREAAQDEGENSDDE